MTGTAMRLGLSKRGWRRCGALVALSMLVKVAVMAVAMAQPAHAAPAGDVPDAQKDLLAALAVICSPGGTKVQPMGGGGADGGDTAKTGLLDCPRCCGPLSTAVHCGGACLGPLYRTAETAPPPAETLPFSATHFGPANPRAPPVSILT